MKNSETSELPFANNQEVLPASLGLSTTADLPGGIILHIYIYTNIDIDTVFLLISNAPLTFTSE